MHIRAKKYNSIRYIVSNILRRHSWFSSVLAAFGSGLTQLLAEFVQLPSGMGPISIVIPNKEHLLSLLEDIVSDLHISCCGNPVGEVIGHLMEDRLVGCDEGGGQTRNMG